MSQKKAIDFGRKWLSKIDLQELVRGSSKLLGLHSQTVQAVCHKYIESRITQKKPFLRNRGNKNLGWVPFTNQVIEPIAEGFKVWGIPFRVFLSRPLPVNYRFADRGSFSQDAMRNWYINVPIEVPDEPQKEVVSEVAIDLGLKEFATLSSGEVVENPRWFREQENKLAIVQRANKHKRHIAKLHASISNKRKDFLHKLSDRLTKTFQHIIVGDVTFGNAKSVLDAGWSSFRNMLSYKAIARGVKVSVVSERFSTQTCSHCGGLPDERPKGIAGLGIREWTCGLCGTHHHRDLNAAINLLLRYGHVSPAVGIPVL